MLFHTARIAALFIVASSLLAIVSGQVVYPKNCGAGQDMKVDGDVGIGTNSPESALHIKKADDVTVIIEADTLAQAAMQLKNDSATWQITADGGNGRLSVNLQDPDLGEVFTISTNGNVAIGEDNPESRLEVIAETSDSSGSVLNLMNSNSESLLLMTNDGRMGVGVENPTEKLHVVGTLKIDDETNYGLIGHTPGNFVFRSFGEGDAEPIIMQQQIDSFSYDRLAINAAGETEVLGLTVNGNAEIGNDIVVLGSQTVEGNSAVNGDLTVDGKIIMDSWELDVPDYVFAKEYNLRDIKALEQFISQNRHLPDVPSESEFKKGGVDMARLNMILLKKIEELTLYVIEQDKKIQDISKKISE